MTWNFHEIGSPAALKALLADPDQNQELPAGVRQTIADFCAAAVPAPHGVPAFIIEVETAGNYDGTAASAASLTIAFLPFRRPGSAPLPG